MDYKKAYYLLFGAAADALEKLEKVKHLDEDLVRAMVILRDAQRATEERYMETGE